MRIELATEPGGAQRPDEDFASVTLPASGQGGSLVLLDGVTPPSGESGCVHSVPWFVARLGGALVELSVSRRDLTLREVLGLSILRTADVHRTSCDLSHPRTPQATVVLARWDTHAVEYLVLSDSVLLLEEPDGRVLPILDDRLDRLPPEVDVLRAAVRGLPDGSAARDAAVREYVAGVEALRNAEGGFFTAAADPAVAGRAVTGSLPREGVRSLAALSDGAGRWVDVFHRGSWQDVPAFLRKEGPQGVIDVVRELERSGAGGSGAERSGAGPRGKRHDDATVVYVEP